MDDRFFKFSIGLIVVAVFMLFIDLKKLELIGRESNPIIGILSEKVGDIKLKYPGTSSWMTIDTGSSIESGCLVFSGANSSAKYTLKDGSTLEQGPNSLIKMKFTFDKLKKFKDKTGSNNKKNKEDKEKLAISLVEGDVSVKNSKDSNTNKVVESKDETVELKGKGGFKMARKKSKMSFSVTDGKVDYNKDGKKAVTVKRGQRLSASGDSAESYRIDRVSERVQKEIAARERAEEAKKKKSINWFLQTILAIFGLN